MAKKEKEPKEKKKSEKTEDSSKNQGPKGSLRRKKPPYMKDIYACLQCGYCRSVCPVYKATEWESLTPRGKVFLLKHFVSKNSILDRVIGRKITDALTGRGKIPLEEVMEKVYTCTLCSNCEEVCHVDIEFHEYWEEIRKWMVENDITPPENTINMYNGIADPQYKNPFNEPVDTRDEWYRDEYDLPETADMVFFIGCVTSYHEYQLLLNTLKIFTKGNLDFTTLGKDEMCCAAINTMSGQWDNFEEVAKHNVEAIKKRGATRVVTGCPGCYRAIKKYKKYTDFEFELLHTTEVVAEMIDKGMLEFKKDFKKKGLPVIYHDSCELGRISEYEGRGIFDAPRDILKAVPGIDEVLEFDTNRMDSQCCGGGGGLKAVNYDLTTVIAGNRLNEAIEKGATTVVSACPNCKVQFGTAIDIKKDEMKKKGEKFKMSSVDVLDIVAKSI